MHHDYITHQSDIYGLASMGTDAIAYMREITAGEIAKKFPGVPDMDANTLCWALFAADGTPLMLASDIHELENSAFYNNLTAVRPN